MAAIRTLTILALVLVSSGATAAETEFGPNLALEPGFENWAEGQPVGWVAKADSADVTRFGPDTASQVEGGTSLKIEIPAQGGADLRSATGIPVEAGAQYLFSLSYRSEGFGEKGKYSGVDAAARLYWVDVAGKRIAANGILPFPYWPMREWDLRDTIVTAPDDAASVVIHCGFRNTSEKQTGTLIPSTLWIDAVRFLRYSAPPDPEEATRKVEKIVEGGWDNSIVKSYNLSSLRYGRHAEIVTDREATDGTCLKALTTEGKGLIAHSPYFPSARPGLYRAVIRVKTPPVADNTPLGTLTIGSERAVVRGLLDLNSSDFDAPDTYQNFSVDFILRGNGWWDVVLSTAANVAWFADTVRVYPLKYLSDHELLDIFPGMEGTIPAGLVPGRGGENSALVVAGLGYDFWGLTDALRLGQKSISPVFVRGGRNQTFMGFPDSPEALFMHGFIVLCNVDAQSLSLKQKKMILEFVARGGGLIILGGHRAFDRGGIQNSLLNELLPVEVMPGDTPVLSGDGNPTKLVKAMAHATTEYVDFSESPLVFWWHQVRAKAGATTLVALANGDPAMVGGSYGKGRVVCVLMTCHGDPQDGQLPFWQWSQWPLLFRDACWWVQQQDQRFQ